jgi:hypothetical protein
MVLTGGVVVCAKAVAALRESNKTIEARSRTAVDREIRRRTNRMGASARMCSRSGDGASSFDIRPM